MKKILQFIFVLSSIVSYSQILSYSDQAVLFSGDDNYGTARYMGMSGAFGALGGDISAVEINPAGLAIFNNINLTTSLGYRDSEINTSFYGNSINNKDDNFRFSQIGGASGMFNIRNSDFRKIAIGFSYSIIKDFDSNFAVSGNSGVPTYVDDPFLNFDDDETNNVYYINSENQYFTNYISGLSDKFTLSIATQYQDYLYIGMSLGFYNINFYQRTYYEENNNDGNGNALNAYLNQDLSTYSSYSLGNGVNFGIGAIFKPFQNLRLGLAYQSPIWYGLSENSILYEDPVSGDVYSGDLEIHVTNNPDERYTEYGERNYFDYDLKTSGKFTGSLAYIFGKFGLISFDYIYQDYSNIYLKPSSSFIGENEELKRGLQNTSSFRLGTEWRYNIFSLRGGYRFEDSPYKQSLNDEDLTGYSFGLGIQFNRMFKLDFAYDNSSYTSTYSFIDNIDVDPAKLDIDNNRFTSTLVINF